MKGLTISAWRDGQYVSLAELLLVLGRLVLKLEWRVRLVEVAPGPWAAQLEDLSPEDTLNTFQLLHRATPDVQIIDGEIVGFEAQNALIPVLLFRAVDSTSWDIEVEKEEVIAMLRVAYPEASLFLADRTAPATCTRRDDDL